MIKTHHTDGKEGNIFHPFQFSVLRSSSKPVLSMEVSKLFIRKNFVGAHQDAIAVQSPDLTSTGELHHRKKFFRAGILYSGAILPMAGQAPGCMLLGSLNWIFLALGENRSCILPKKANLLPL